MKLSSLPAFDFTNRFRAGRLGLGKSTSKEKPVNLEEPVGGCLDSNFCQCHHGELVKFPENGHYACMNCLAEWYPNGRLTPGAQAVQFRRHRRVRDERPSFGQTVLAILSLGTLVPK